MPIVDAQLEVAAGLAYVEGLDVNVDGRRRAFKFASKDVLLLWNVEDQFLAWVAPAPGATRLPARVRPSRPRKSALETAEKQRAAEVWATWAPGAAQRAGFFTERTQDVPLTGPWADVGEGVAIQYRSDKFNPRGQLVRYTHPFDTPPRVEVMEGRGYQVWVVSGPGLRVTARGIEG